MVSGLWFLLFISCKYSRLLACNGASINGSEEDWSGYTGPDYRKEIFPPVASDMALEVGISVLVRNIPKIDETRGLVLLEVNLRVKWQDSRLVPPPEVSPQDYVPLDPSILSEIWVPDIYIDHSPSAITPSVLTDIASVWIYGDGTVDYSGNMFVEVACKMDYAWFPRDHQICNIRFESYAYTLSRNEYKWVPPGLEISKDIPSEQFLVKFEKVQPYTRVQDVYGTYPALAFRIHLTRRMTFMLLQVYLPSGLFVVVSFVSLLVPPEAIPGRMTLCITTILTMSALLGIAMQSTPQVSYTRAIDVWLLACLSYVSIVLLEFGIVIKLNEVRNQQSQANAKTKIIRVIKAPEPEVEPRAESSYPQSKTKERFSVSARQVEKISLIGLPSSFLLFNLVYWWWFLLGSETAIPTGLGKNATAQSAS